MWLRYRGFKALSIVLVGGILATGILLSGGAMVIKGRVVQSNEYWSHYQDISSSKEQAISALVSDMGYGGMIHQFKNYVLRKDAKRLGKIHRLSGSAFGALRACEASGVNVTEQRA